MNDDYLKTKHLHIRVSQHLLTALKAAAKRHKVQPAVIVRSAIQKELERLQEVKP